MAEQANLVQEGVDRVNEAWRSANQEVQRLQKQLLDRRRSIERQLSSGRKSFEKQTRKQFTRVRSELRKSPWTKRAQGLRAGARKRIEEGIDGVLGSLRVASRADVERIDRRLMQISKRLKEIERAKKANGEAAGV